MDELKPCCGKELFIQKIILSHVRKFNYWMVWCGICNFAIKEATKKAAIAAWNRREAADATE